MRNHPRATAKPLRGIQSAWVKEFEAVVEIDKVTRFQVNVKISFLLEGTGAG
nr:dodecin family protein [Methylobacterium sp. Leaf122]